ncbi:unnamed protein product, partial [Heterosigma akashiwo]
NCFLLLLLLVPAAVAAAALPGPGLRHGGERAQAPRPGPPPARRLPLLLPLVAVVVRERVDAGARRGRRVLRAPVLRAARGGRTPGAGPGPGRLRRGPLLGGLLPNAPTGNSPTLRAARRAARGRADPLMPPLRTRAWGCGRRWKNLSPKGWWKC